MKSTANSVIKAWYSSQIHSGLTQCYMEELVAEPVDLKLVDEIMALTSDVPASLLLGNMDNSQLPVPYFYTDQLETSLHIMRARLKSFMLATKESACELTIATSCQKACFDENLQDSEVGIINWENLLTIPQKFSKTILRKNIAKVFGYFLMENTHQKICFSYSPENFEQAHDLLKYRMVWSLENEAFTHYFRIGSEHTFN